MSAAEAIWPLIRFERETDRVVGYSVLVDGDRRKPLALAARLAEDAPDDALERACLVVREALRMFVEGWSATNGRPDAA